LGNQDRHRESGIVAISYTMVWTMG